MNGYFPSVAMKVPQGKSREECVGMLMRFLSNLSWVERHGILVDSISGGSHPRPVGREKTRGFAISEELDLSYFPEPTDERALLALALMREGRGLNPIGAKITLDPARLGLILGTDAKRSIGPGGPVLRPVEAASGRPRP